MLVQITTEVRTSMCNITQKIQSYLPVIALLLSYTSDTIFFSCCLLEGLCCSIFLFKDTPKVFNCIQVWWHTWPGHLKKKFLFPKLLHNFWPNVLNPYHTKISLSAKSLWTGSHLVCQCFDIFKKTEG